MDNIISNVSPEDMNQINAFGERFKEKFPNINLMMIIPLFMIIDADTWKFPDYVHNMKQTKEILEFIENDKELKNLFQSKRTVSK